MKWAILLGSPAIGGGTYVIFEHAVKAVKKGEDVTIITANKVTKEDVAWHKGAEILKFATYEQGEQMEFDLCIATWWRSVYEAYRIPAKRYLYFVQSIESKFYRAEEKPIRQLAEATYMLPMDIITEATWIKDYLWEHYNKKAYLVRNGIRKDVYTPQGEAMAPKEEGKLRVLVEGPIDVDFKNVPKTIKLCRQSKADELWLMTASDIKEYEGVDRVISRVPMFETPKVYRSCDVIVKLSYVEGMFGPPLEMYHCGGTSITYDVTGYDEYIEHGVNGLVVKTDDDKKVVEYINKLKTDREYLNKLKQGAARTAAQWHDWDTATEEFYNTVKLIMSRETAVTRKIITDESKFHFQSYVIAEDYYNELKLLKERTFSERLWLKIKSKIPISFKDRVKGILGIKGEINLPGSRRK